MENESLNLYHVAEDMIRQAKSLLELSLNELANLERKDRDQMSIENRVKYMIKSLDVTLNPPEHRNPFIPLSVIRKIPSLAKMDQMPSRNCSTTDSEKSEKLLQLEEQIQTLNAEITQRQQDESQLLRDAEQLSQGLVTQAELNEILGEEKLKLEQKLSVLHKQHQENLDELDRLELSRDQLIMNIEQQKGNLKKTLKERDRQIAKLQKELEGCTITVKCERMNKKYSEVMSKLKATEELLMAKEILIENLLRLTKQRLVSFHDSKFSSYVSQ